ncbi:hypothetical protein B0I31_10266 [Saccharothrix carnea]|uniref:EamA domain-containing protein n=2 Tax=Saccharothrix carnea TaxID=1280637 RepID=A0A2P8IF35_SACCR|nr:hypothetical protein B0I31_10266 [Saccharothrix carnea]
MVALNWGERHADAGTAALIVGIGPILVAFLAGWLLREGFPARLLAGLAIAFAGVAAVGLLDSGGGSTTWGALRCLVAAAGYAVGVVAQKPALGHASALQAITFGCVVGAIVCLPFGGRLLGDLPDARRPPRPQWCTWLAADRARLLHVGLPAVAHDHRQAGRHDLPGAGDRRAAVWALMDEIPGVVALAGGALCLMGVAVSQGRPQPAVTASR